MKKLIFLLGGIAILMASDLGASGKTASAPAPAPRAPAQSFDDYEKLLNAPAFHNTFQLRDPKNRDFKVDRVEIGDGKVYRVDSDENKKSDYKHYRHIVFSRKFWRSAPKAPCRFKEVTKVTGTKYCWGDYHLSDVSSEISLTKFGKNNKAKFTSFADVVNYPLTFQSFNNAETQKESIKPVEHIEVKDDSGRYQTWRVDSDNRDDEALKLARAIPNFYDGLQPYHRHANRTVELSRDAWRVPILNDHLIKYKVGLHGLRTHTVSQDVTEKALKEKDTSKLLQNLGTSFINLGSGSPTWSFTDFGKRFIAGTATTAVLVAAAWYKLRKASN